MSGRADWLADDAKWNASFAASAPELGRLAAEALEEYRAGRTEEVGFDELLADDPAAAGGE